MKTKIKASTEKKSIKVLRISFKVIVTIIYIFFAIMLIFVSAGSVIPYVADYFAGILHLTTDIPIIVLAISWGLPVLFVSGFLFVIDYKFLKWLYPYSLGFIDKVFSMNTNDTNAEIDVKTDVEIDVDIDGESVNHDKAIDENVTTKGSI